MDHRSLLYKEIFYDGEPVTAVFIDTEGASNRTHWVCFFDL